jgi:hypothetical protein
MILNNRIGKNAIEQINVQNRIFENTIQQALIDAPEGDKKRSMKFKSL